MSGYIGTQPVPQATQTRDSFTATSGQTSFATGGYTPNFLDVYLNGVKLASADYTATNGSDVVLASGAATGDILEVVAYTAFDTANVTGATNFTVTGAFTSQGIDDNGNATALTIDSSERVIVGGTSPFSADTITLDTGGFAVIRNTSGSCLELRRDSSDGSILDFQKDGTTVGSIGTQGSRLSIGSGDVNLNFNASANSMYPISDPAAGTLSSGIVDLGAALATFKDLYLSGGVYLGGTGSANKLSDVETGSFTPTVTWQSGSPSYSSQGRYTKVGNIVNVRAQIIVNASGGSGVVSIQNLPFTAYTITQTGFGSERGNNGKGLVVWVDSSSTRLNMRYYDYTDVGTTSGDVMVVSAAYQVA